MRRWTSVRSAPPAIRRARLEQYREMMAEGHESIDRFFARAIALGAVGGLAALAWWLAH
jgi:hypothetical protein